MSKRSATETLTTTQHDGQPFNKASGSGAKRENVTNDEMGEFEDAWEDEIESDEEVVDAEAEQNDDGMSTEAAEAFKILIFLSYGHRRQNPSCHRRVRRKATRTKCLHPWQACIGPGRDTRTR